MAKEKEEFKWEPVPYDESQDTTSTQLNAASLSVLRKGMESASKEEKSAVQENLIAKITEVEGKLNEDIELSEEQTQSLGVLQELLLTGNENTNLPQVAYMYDQVKGYPKKLNYAVLVSVAHFFYDKKAPYDKAIVGMYLKWVNVFKKVTYYNNYLKYIYTCYDIALAQPDKKSAK